MYVNPLADRSLRYRRVPAVRGSRGSGNRWRVERTRSSLRCDVSFIGSGQYTYRHALLRRVASASATCRSAGPLGGRAPRFCRSRAGRCGGQQFAQAVRGAAPPLGALALPAGVRARLRVSSGCGRSWGAAAGLGPRVPGISTSRGTASSGARVSADHAVELARTSLGRAEGGAHRNRGGRPAKNSSRRTPTPNRRAPCSRSRRYPIPDAPAAPDPLVVPELEDPNAVAGRWTTSERQWRRCFPVEEARPDSAARCPRAGPAATPGPRPGARRAEGRSPASRRRGRPLSGCLWGKKPRVASRLRQDGVQRTRPAE